MALNPVTLAETLRPWHRAGLMFLLREPRDFSAGEDSGERSFTSSAPQSSFTRPSTERKAARLAASSRTTSTSVLEQEERLLSDASHAAAPVSVSSPLPQEWAHLLGKTPKNPLLWTYAALGQDLGGNGDKERSACLRELIGRLMLPRGTSSFWPVTLCEDWQSYAQSRLPAPDAAYFQAGLRQLAPKVVVFIGEPALFLSGLQQRPNVPFTQSVQQGCLYLLLPDFDALLGTTALTERSVAYLQSAFSAYPSLFSRAERRS